MKTFIVLGHDTPVTPFALDNLAGEGRMDLLARCVNAAFLKSHGIREDTRLFLVLDDYITLRFEGPELGGINPDERSIAALISKALNQHHETEQKISNGFYASIKSFEELLEEFDSVITLHENGEDIVEAEMPEEPVFVLSDNQDFTAGEKKLLEDSMSVSLGPEVLHTDHSITVAQNFLDRGMK
ncbi:MAG: tRNA (pseudouridine(54)-N(1))-methyltransferase TrmY [Candidatus Nanohaloarchaea archaeon]